MNKRSLRLLSVFILIQFVVTTVLPTSLFAEEANVGAPLAAPQTREQQLIEKAKYHYYHMNWSLSRRQAEEARDLLKGIGADGQPQPLTGARKDQFVEASMILAEVHLALDRKAEAIRVMEEAARLDPDFRPDPKWYPPKVTRAYEEARANVVIGLAHESKPSLPTKVAALNKQRELQDKPFYKKPIFWIATGVVAAGLGAGIGMAMSSGGGGSNTGVGLNVPPLGVRQ
ncbi:MAG: hypothetical protein Q7S98_00810 [Deltaproteobacteria bacterium]|nr:hypothetical protein [Deltaproteobacteria bacterium]